MFIKLFVARIKDVFAAADIPSPVRKPTQLPGAPPPGLRPAAQICSVYHPRWSETRRGHNSLCIIPVGRRPDGGTTAFASSPLVGDQTGAQQPSHHPRWSETRRGAQQPSHHPRGSETRRGHNSLHPRWSKTRRGHNSLRIIPVGRRPDGGTTAFASFPVGRRPDGGKTFTLLPSLWI